MNYHIVMRSKPVDTKDEMINNSKKKVIIRDGVEWWIHEIVGFDIPQET